MKLASISRVAVSVIVTATFFSLGSAAEAEDVPVIHKSAIRINCNRVDGPAIETRDGVFELVPLGNGEWATSGIAWGPWVKVVDWHCPLPPIGPAN